MKDEEVVGKVQEIVSEYNERLRSLNSTNPVSIDYALRYLAYQREVLRVKRDSDLNEIEKHEKVLGIEEGILREARRHLPKEATTDFDTLKGYIENKSQITFRIMEEFRRQLQAFYMRNKLPLNAVRVTPPEEFEDGKIPVSKGLLTQYEEEMGDFVFASSTDSKRNAYLARTHGKGMYGLSEDTYFYPGKNLSVENGRLMISKTGYIYYMEPDEFTPVVTIAKDKDGMPYFRFGEEWTIPRDIDLEEDVIKVDEFRDVTDILDHIQAISSTDTDIVSNMYSRDLSNKEKFDMLIQGIVDGRVQYWNGVLNRNPILRDRIERRREEYRNRSVEEMKREIGEEQANGSK